MSNVFSDTPPLVNQLQVVTGKVLRSEALVDVADAQNWGFANVGMQTQFAQWYRKAIIIESEGEATGDYLVAEFIVPAVTDRDFHPYRVTVHGWTNADLGDGERAIVEFRSLTALGGTVDAVEVDITTSNIGQFSATLDVAYLDAIVGDRSFKVGRIAVYARTEDIVGSGAEGLGINYLSVDPLPFTSPLANTVYSAAPHYIAGNIINYRDPVGAQTQAEITSYFEPLSITDEDLVSPAGESANTAIPSIMLQNLDYLSKRPIVRYNAAGIPRFDPTVTGSVDPSDPTTGWWQGEFYEDQHFRMGLNRGWRGCVFPVWEGLGSLPVGDDRRRYFVAAKIGRYSELDEVAGFSVADGKCRIALAYTEVRDSETILIGEDILELTPPVPTDVDEPESEWVFGILESSNFSVSVLPANMGQPFQVIGTSVVGPGYKNVGAEPLAFPGIITDCYLESLAIWSF